MSLCRNSRHTRRPQRYWTLTVEVCVLIPHSHKCGGGHASTPKMLRRCFLRAMGSSLSSLRRRRLRGTPRKGTTGLDTTRHVRISHRKETEAWSYTTTLSHSHSSQQKFLCAQVRDITASSRLRVGLVVAASWKLQGQYHPHQTEAHKKQSGGRWRRRPRRNIEGDGCEVWL